MKSLTAAQTEAVTIKRFALGKSSLMIVIMQLANPEALPIANVMSIRKKRTANS